VTDAVLDASAVLAYALGEPGGEIVRKHLFGATISAVNYSEVLKKTIERGGDMQDIASLLKGARVNVVAFDVRQAADAAALYRKTKDAGISFADRAGLALAVELNASLYTADARLADVDVPIDVVLIREPMSAGAKKRK
jgi:ribonuclease VapC